LLTKIILEVFGLVYDLFSLTQIEGVLSSLRFEKSSCPRCGNGSFIKHGRTSLGRQRYMCRECRKTFSETTGTSFMYSKKTLKTWAGYLLCMPVSASYRVEGFTLENAVNQTRVFLIFLKGFRSVASKYLSHYVNWYRTMMNEGCSLPAQMIDE
jgi:transposase-like protein